MPTVIDQFIVKYTLDTKDLDKGSRQVEKDLDKLNRKSKEAGSALGDSVEAGAKRATGSLGMLGSMLGKGGMIGIALGSLIYAGKVVDDKMFSVARSLRRLGIDSKNFGKTASEMRNLQNASEMVGGSMEDATQTVSDLSKSLFDLKFNGQVSGSLLMLSRLGVQFQDSYGRARDFEDVMLDTATAIERAKAAGRMTDAEAFQFATQAGFSGGMAQLVTGGRSAAERELAKQQARRQVQGKDVAGATRWERSSISLGQAKVAEIGNAGMDAYGNKRAGFNEGVESAGTATVEALKDFGLAVDKVTDKLSRFFSSIPSSSSGARAGRAVMGSGNMTRGLRNNNPLNLKALKGQRADKDGFRIFDTMEEGIRAADRQLGINESRGTDTVSEQVNTWAPASDNNDVAAYLRSIKKQTGLDPNSKTGPGNRVALMAAMALHESGPGAPSAAQVEAALNMGPRGGSGSIRSGNSTTVQIDKIVVETQATDANGIARDINGALTSQKFLTAHAERGMD